MMGDNQEGLYLNRVVDSIRLNNSDSDSDLNNGSVSESDDVIPWR